MVADDGAGGLLGLELEARLLVDLDPDPGGVEQVGHPFVVGQVGAGGVAPRVAPAAVLLAEQPGQAGPVLVGEAPLLADPAVPVLGEG